MRALIILSVSAIALTGCLTTQENPNYEHSTAYKGETGQTNQYAAAPSSIPATSYGASTVSYPAATYHAGVPSVDISTVNHNGAASHPIYASTAPTFPGSTSITTSGAAPTDLDYQSDQITGTPGFMAMQNEAPTVAVASTSPALSATQNTATAPLGAAGTPIAYDYSRNLVSADALTTGQQLPYTVRMLSNDSRAYTVQPGDTVYSLSRRTCVGVNVIQSMNGLAADYGIKIGQSLSLPTSIC